MRPLKFERSFKQVLSVSFLFILLAGCGVTQKTSKNSPPAVAEPLKLEIDSVKIQAPLQFATFALEDVPETPREFRGVWVATVSNIDWPSRPGLPVAKQKAELKTIMERAAELHLNAVIFQIRPAADALYDSSYEPWSYYLTGRQGEAPEPYYDPLKFAIKQAHKRGLELHAWFNPFRAYHPTAEELFASGHVINTHPDWVVAYNNHYWLNPGLKKVRRYSINVIMDVVKRYDIDGVHLDDYFYPYPRFLDNGNPVPFPDDWAYSRYLETHPPIRRDDWRRQNVNKFVKKLGKAINQADSTLLFGISPFGIWRPGHPSPIVGLDAYARIYADSRKWLRKGWVDYLAPQLYWAIDNEGQRFPVLLRWWNRQNIQNRFIWPGLYTSNIANYPEYGFPSTEIINQIELAREMQQTAGHIHFSMQALMQNYGDIGDELLAGPYRHEVLVPAASWKGIQQPAKPKAKLKQLEDHYKIRLSPEHVSSPWLWVIKVKYGNSWEINIYPGRKDKLILPKQTKEGAFLGAAVLRVNEQSVESELVLLFPKVEQLSFLGHY